MASVIDQLLRKQAKHAEMLTRVEEGTARLDRHKRKLGELETSISALESLAAAPHRRRGPNGRAAPGTRRAQLIFNPTSGRDASDSSARLVQIVSGLRDHGIEVAIGLKTSGKAARNLARNAVRDEAPLVIVAAGDGTISDVAAELVGTPVALGIVPIGTMNNLARALGIPLAIDEASALIGMGTIRHIDIGRVRTHESAHDEYFLECAGVGLSAIGALAGQSFEKRRWRMFPRALRRYFEARLGAVRIELDDTAIDASTRIVTVSNAPLMGNNMLAAPGAKMDDGFLDVSVYDGMGDAALVGHFLSASSHTPDDLRIYRARRVRITTDQAVLSNVGTKITAERNVVEIEIVPGALAMIVGNGIGLTTPVEGAPSAPTYATGPPQGNGAENGDSTRNSPGRTS